MSSCILSPEDSLSGFLVYQLSHLSHDNEYLSPLARKICAKIGYSLLAITGIVEAVARFVLGIVSLLASSLTKQGAKKQSLYCRIFLFGALFSAMSTGLAVRNIFDDKPLYKASENE